MQYGSYSAGSPSSLNSSNSRGNSLIATCSSDSKSVLLILSNRRYLTQNIEDVRIQILDALPNFHLISCCWDSQALQTRPIPSQFWDDEFPHRPVYKSNLTLPCVSEIDAGKERLNQAHHSLMVYQLSKRGHGGHPLLSRRQRNSLGKFLYAKRSAGDSEEFQSYTSNLLVSELIWSWSCQWSDESFETCPSKGISSRTKLSNSTDFNKSN